MGTTHNSEAKQELIEVRSIGFRSVKIPVTSGIIAPLKPCAATVDGIVGSRNSLAAMAGKTQSGLISSHN